jgi:hypothetical protein
MKRKKIAPVSSPEDQAPAGVTPHVVERPGGFYWREKEGAPEYGPFPSRAIAEAEMLSGGDGELEPGETLQEAESELGISEWTDPDTGGPAEDHVPRIEDH